MEIIKKENKKKKPARATLWSPYSPCHHPCGSEHDREEKKLSICSINYDKQHCKPASECNRLQSNKHKIELSIT